MEEHILDKIFINKNLDLDEREMSVMAALNEMYSNKHDYLYTSISIIGYELTGRFLKTKNKKDRNLRQSIQRGIDSLNERKIIEVIDCDGDNYVISGKGLEVDTQRTHFVVIELWEMQKIFQTSAKPFNTFTFFVALIGTINNATKEWHMSQDDMTVYFGCGKGTVNKYLTELEELELIYVYRHRRRRADGTYHKLNNSYGRFADKKKIINAATEYADTVVCEEFSEKIDRRSIKLRYNAFCEGSKKYDDIEEVKKLYSDCLKYNDSIKKNPISGTYEGEYKEGGELDLSVFPKLESDCEFDDTWGEPDNIDNDIYLIEETV